MWKRSDRRREDATEFTGGEQLRIDFRRKQVWITHWKLQYFLRAHEFTPPLAKSTSGGIDINYTTFRIFFVVKIVVLFSRGKLRFNQLAFADEGAS